MAAQALVAQRRPRTYFRCRLSSPPTTFGNPSTLNPEQSLVIRSWCGAKRMILQNKPNFPNTKMHPTPCIEMTYGNIILSDNPKNKPNLTQFSVGAGFGALGLVLGICLVFWISCLGFCPRPIAAPCPLSSACHGEAPWAKPGTYPKPLSCPNSFCRQSMILQNKPNFQKPKINLTLYSKMAYERVVLSDNPKNKPNSHFLSGLGFGFWILGFVWYFGFRAWDFITW